MIALVVINNIMVLKTVIPLKYQTINLSHYSNSYYGVLGNHIVNDHDCGLYFALLLLAPSYVPMFMFTITNNPFLTYRIAQNFDNRKV